MFFGHRGARFRDLKIFRRVERSNRAKIAGRAAFLAWHTKIDGRTQGKRFEGGR